MPRVIMDGWDDDTQYCLGVGSTHDLSPGRPRRKGTRPIGFVIFPDKPPPKPKAQKPVAKKPQRRPRRK